MDYPLTLARGAQVTKGATTVSTTFTIHIDRDMNETFRTRVMDALKFGGIRNFFRRSVPCLRSARSHSKGAQSNCATYAKEPREKGTRLVLVADRRSFFSAIRESASRVRADDGGADPRRQGTGTGTMTGAARVKPSPDWRHRHRRVRSRARAAHGSQASGEITAITSPRSSSTPS
jgi:hypothetical protein